MPPDATTQEIIDGLSKRLYAIPEAKLGELLAMIEAEYVSRLAARAGYIEEEIV